MHNVNILVLLLCATFCVISSQMLGTSLKNMTEIEKAKPKTKKDDSPLKKEIRKYLRECGADISDEESEEEGENEENNEKQTALWGGENDGKKKQNRGTYPASYGPKGKGTYPTSYGSDAEYSDEDSDEDDEDSDERGNNGRRSKMKYRVAKSVETFGVGDSTFENYRNRNEGKRGGNKRKQNEDSEESDEDEDGCEDQDKNQRGNNKNNRNKNNRNNGNNRNKNKNQGGGNNGNNKRGGYSYGGGRYGEDDSYGGYGRDPYMTRYGGGGGGGDDFGPYGGWSYGGRLRRLPYREIEILSRRRRARDQDQDQDQDPDQDQDQDPDQDQDQDQDQPQRPKEPEEPGEPHEDAQCLSQCVFGYLELLDDNRVPSETEVIKYFQQNIPNSSQRMKTIREARRCFAKLATSDTDDGCGFSKSLAKCLKLDMESKTK